jgi:ankyrin repeat protein
MSRSELREAIYYSLYERYRNASGQNGYHNLIKHHLKSSTGGLSLMLRFGYEYGHVRMVKLLLDRTTDWNNYFDVAIRNNYIHILKLLLNRGYEIQDKNINTPMLYFKNYKTVEAIVKFCSQSQLDDLLYRLYQTNSVKMVKVLLKAGANVRSSNVLMDAIREDDVKVTKLLLQSGGDINDRPYLGLQDAVTTSNIGMIKLMLQFDIDKQVVEYSRKYLKKCRSAARDTSVV